MKEIRPWESLSSPGQAGLLARIYDLRLETTGRFLHQDGSVLPW